MPYQNVERRRALAAAALGRDVGPPEPAPADDDSALEAVSGVISDISPHLMIVEDDEGAQRRLVIAPWATAWRGAALPPADLPTGARVLIRALRSGTVVDRIWADTTRITGTITTVHGRRDLTLELDAGPHRGHRSIVIPYRSTGRIRVRHPQLEAGYLFDAIGIADGDTTLALLPATSQPPYRARAVPPPPPAYRGTQSTISGTAVWSDLDDHGVAYPMLETSDTGCGDAGISCAGLPYLALGSALHVRNLCDDRSSTLPVVACGCVAGRFCDRCLECGTSPRGRIVELSAASFVALGGDLIKGCFNARIGLG
ncbi:hypothetical protein JOL79_31825 [Microbispora sp. RL4-1S]|uniref:Uncharacterized protein n=1 Tax=Microbispora oryzae TaxID=2806554 RepID=A0A940WS47_9ACTN|nr:hypothetical protein [Microbispora oryzae]MBP2708378.1 hypothetical protein [Microbispora oryzae]